MNSLKFIADKFGIDLNAKSPIQLPISRQGLAKLFAELRFKHGAEIGTERGLYARALCKYNPDLTLYCIDAWQTFRGYRDHTRQAKLDSFYQITKERLKPYNAKIVRQFSLDAVQDFNDQSLDFVYIDANHEFLAVAQDIAAWSKKVKYGGIVAGHDFEKHRGNSLIHVKEAVCGWTDAYNIRPCFTTNTDAEDTGADGELKTARSFFWVRQPFEIGNRKI